MPASRALQIEAAIRAKQLVCFERPFEEFPARGYVLAAGPKFFLLAVVNDRIRLDGFECFRISDIRNFKPDPYAAFVEAALKKRGESIPKKPRIDLSDIESLLKSAGRAFPLVTIHRERVDPEVCWIGQPLSIDKGHISLLGVTPDATWETEPETFRLSEITRVGFGSDYEDALYLVAGDPPAKSR